MASTLLLPAFLVIHPSVQNVFPSFPPKGLLPAHIQLRCPLFYETFQSPLTSGLLHNIVILPQSLPEKFTCVKCRVPLLWGYWSDGVSLMQRMNQELIVLSVYSVVTECVTARRILTHWLLPRLFLQCRLQDAVPDFTAGVSCAFLHPCIVSSLRTATVSSSSLYLGLGMYQYLTGFFFEWTIE